MDLRVARSGSAAQRFGLAAERLALEAPFLGPFAGAGGLAALERRENALHQLLETCQCRFAVGFLAASFLGFDDDASLGDADGSGSYEHGLASVCGSGGGGKRLFRW